MVNDVKVTWKRNRYLIPHPKGGELGCKVRKSIDCDIIEYRNKSEEGI